MTRVVLLFVLIASLAAGQAPPAGREGPARGAVEGHLTWFDRQGNRIGTLGEAGVYRTLSVSPDGKRVAAERTEQGTGNRDIWIFDAAGGTGKRLTTDAGWDAFPVWSPDGSRIIFTSNRGGTFDLYRRAMNGDGTDELFYKSGEGKGPNSWSPDGKYLVYYSIGQPTHLRLLAVNGPPERPATPVVDNQFSSITGRFSPDGRWILYSSNETGQTEVSVRPFDSATGAIGNAVVLTADGGRYPLWRGDGKEIYYMNGDGMVMAMEVTPGKTFGKGLPKSLFKAPAGVLFWDVAPGGQRFLMPATP
jgi:eukaryotic-like serine/threonine-protein kinase